MLHLVIPDQEFWDPVKERFITVQGGELDLEHSLASISKWESKWHIPFHDDRKEKTYEQNIDYIRCMTLTKNVNPEIYKYLTEQNVKDIMDYISDSSTATWFSDSSTKKIGKKEIITAEIIYYWMTAYNIPETYQTWHLNKLMTLLRVAAEKNNEAYASSSKKKFNPNLSAQRRSLNEARKKKYGTRG